MPDRRLSCLESVVLVVSNSCSSKARAGLPGRLAGLLAAAFLATAPLPRRTLFQRLVFCMIDHGRLPASPSWAQVVSVCGGKTTHRGCNVKVWSSWVAQSVQSSPVQSTESRWTMGRRSRGPSRAMWSVDLRFVVVSCSVGQTLLGGSGIFAFCTHLAA